MSVTVPEGHVDGGDETDVGYVRSPGAVNKTTTRSSKRTAGLCYILMIGVARVGAGGAASGLE